jgi:hypothetical protein
MLIALATRRPIALRPRCANERGEEFEISVPVEGEGLEIFLSEEEGRGEAGMVFTKLSGLAGGRPSPFRRPPGVLDQRPRIGADQGERIPDAGWRCGARDASGQNRT